MGDVCFFVSTEMERNRRWSVNTGSLAVVTQAALTIPMRWNHPLGSGGRNYVHVPFRTIDELMRFRPDAVISGELGARSMLAALYCERHELPLVLWVDVAESTELGRGVVRRLVRRALLRSRSAVAVNGSSGARYVAGFGVDEDRIVTVPLPVEMRRAAPAAPRTSPDGRLRLLYAGRLLGLKGVTPFLAALARCLAAAPERQVRMTFLGDGPEKEALARIALPANLSVVLRREVPYEEMPVAYAGNDVLVLPTFGDTWGQVVAEAMSFGLPVLGSRRSQAAEELLDEGVSGWLFDPVSPGETEGAIQRLLACDGATIRAMGMAAQRAVQRLTPERSADAMTVAIAKARQVRRRGQPTGTPRGAAGGPDSAASSRGTA